MKKILPILLTLLLLLTACGGEQPGQTEQPAASTAPVHSGTNAETQAPMDSEGIRDGDTTIIYALMKMIVTNDAGQELWGREYSYDDRGFCTGEREFSNIGGESGTRVNIPDGSGRKGSTDVTEADGTKYVIVYTYDDQDRVIREDLTHEDGTAEYTEYTYNEKGNYLTLRQFIGEELVMDYAFSYTYDGEGRQMSMDEYLFGELMYHVALEYDDQGREIASTTSLINGEIQSRTVSQWDGLTETRMYYSGQEEEPFMVSVFTYDGNSNVVFEETRQGDMVLNRTEYLYEPLEVRK